MSLKNNTLNVMHLSSSLYRGGAERLLVDFAKTAGKQENISLYVVVMNRHIDEGLKNELSASGARVTFLNRAEGHKHPKYLFSILRMVRKNSIRVIHSHDYGSKMWSIACKLFIPGLKLIHTVHDTNIISRYNKLNLFIHKHFINQNIAISKSVRDECLSFGVIRIKQIYNGICTADFRREHPHRGNENGPLRIINVSRIVHEKKGQDILLKALKRCQDSGLDFECTFVGDIAGADRPSYEYLFSLAKTLGLDKKITFLGKRNDVPQLLKKHDVFILCSRYEGLGLVVLEAMAAGLPVIASGIDGPKELIDNGETGLLFQSENDLELSENILRLARDKELAEGLTKRASLHVNRFDISVMAKNYIDLYEETAGMKNE